MHYKIFFSLLFLLPVTAFSQLKLSGKLIDADNTPLPFATVQLLKPDSSLVLSDLTKEDGSFILSAKSGPFIFRISRFGKTLYIKDLSLSQDTSLGIITVATMKGLAEVTVQARKPMLRQEYDKLIFSVENSPLKSGYNGLEVLARTPKLQVNALGELLLRNTAPVILINGRRLNLSGQELMTYLMGLNAEMIKSIEIQNTGSAGNDAASPGGVVNIVLKRAANGYKATLTSSYTYRRGNYWSGYTGINNNYGSDKWNFYSKLNYRKDNDYGTFITRKDFLNTQGGSNLATGAFTGRKKSAGLLAGLVFYPNKKVEFGAEIYYSNAKGLYNTPENLVVNAPQLYSVSDNYRSEDYKTDTWYTTLNYSYKTDTLGSAVKFIGDLGHNKNLTDNTTDTHYTYGSFADSRASYLVVPLSDYYTIQADWTQKLAKKWKFATGLKYGSVKRNNTLATTLGYPPNQTADPNGQEDFDNTEAITAGYFSFAGQINTRHQFKAGLRIERTGFTGANRINNTEVAQNYTGLFPSLYYGYTPADGKTLSVSYSRSLQRPSFRDLNPFVRKENDYSYILGNPNLKPQYTNSIDVSYQFHNHSISLYGNQTNDLIAGVYTNQENVTYYKPVNFGNQKQLGVDYSYAGDIAKWLYANISGGSYYYIFKQGELNPSRLAFTSSIYTRIKFLKTWSADVTNTLNSRFQSYVVDVAPQYRMDLIVQKNILAGKGTVKLFWNDVFNSQRDKNFSTYQNFTLDFYQKRITQSYTLMFIYNFSTHAKVNSKAVQSGNDARGRL